MTVTNAPVPGISQILMQRTTRGAYREPHMIVSNESAHRHGIFSPEDFSCDQANDVCVCHGGNTPTTTGTWRAASLLCRASMMPVTWGHGVARTRQLERCHRSLHEHAPIWRVRLPGPG